jgi:hypothetical protein
MFDKLLTIFDNIRTWWQTDPQAKMKVIFGVIISITLFFIILLVVFIITSTSTNSNSTDQNNSSATSSITLVTSESFLQGNRLTKISDKAITNPNTMILNGKDSVFINSNRKLVYKDKEIPNSPLLIPLSMYEKDDKIIINESNQVTVFNTKDNSFIKLGENVQNLIPIGDKYYYAYRNAKSLIVRSSSNLNDLDKPEKNETLGNIRPNINNDLFEIVSIQNQPYFFFWQNINKTGILEIWKKNSNDFQIVNNIAEINSFRASKNGFFYSANTVGNRVDNIYYDFNDDIFGKKYTLDTANITNQFRELDINGEFDLGRCNEINQKLMCLVKKEDIILSDSQFVDKIVEIDYLQNNKVKKQFDGLDISGAHIRLGKDNKIYIIGQESKLLYQIQI